MDASTQVGSACSALLIAVALPLLPDTSHPACGYQIMAGSRVVIWAPEFWRFPGWAEGADLMFTEAAAWNGPIRFRDGVGSHAPVTEVAIEAARCYPPPGLRSYRPAGDPPSTRERDSSSASGESRAHVPSRGSGLSRAGPGGLAAGTAAAANVSDRELQPRAVPASGR